MSVTYAYGDKYTLLFIYKCFANLIKKSTFAQAE